MRIKREIENLINIIHQQIVILQQLYFNQKNIRFKFFFLFFLKKDFSLEKSHKNLLSHSHSQVPLKIHQNSSKSLQNLNHHRESPSLLQSQLNSNTYKPVIVNNENRSLKSVHCSNPSCCCSRTSTTSSSNLLKNNKSKITTTQSNGCKSDTCRHLMSKSSELNKKYNHTKSRSPSTRSTTNITSFQNSTGQFLYYDSKGRLNKGLLLQSSSTNNLIKSNTVNHLVKVKPPVNRPHLSTTTSRSNNSDTFSLLTSQAKSSISLNTKLASKSQYFKTSSIDDTDTLR
jgi:hypothetical protein